MVYDTWFWLWFSTFALLLYVVTVDKNVADYIVLRMKLVWINIRRYYYIIQFHPSNRVSRWFFERRLNKMIKSNDKLQRSDLDNGKRTD